MVIPFGGTSNLTAVGTPSGGAYTWFPPFFITPGAGGNATCSATVPGTYVVTVTYSLRGQTVTATVNVTVNAIKVDFGAMPTRIAPTQPAFVTITVTPSPLPIGVTLDVVCEADAGTVGSATVFPTSISATGTVTITGGVQSWSTGTNAAPGNIKLKVKLGSTVLATSTGFTVCAHCIDCKCTLDAKDLAYGLRVKVSWGSNSGNGADLDKCEVTELITYSNIPNPPFCNTDGTDLKESGKTQRVPTLPIPGTLGNTGAVEDLHKHPSGLISNPPTTGFYNVAQAYQFRCLRCNDGWTDMATYSIRYNIYNSTSVPPVDLKFIVKKTGPGGPFISDEDIPGF